MQEEATWMARAQAEKRSQAIGSIFLSLQALVLETQKEPLVTLRELSQKFPNSMVIALYYKQLLAEKASDEAEITRIYRDLLAKYPSHALILNSYTYVVMKPYQETGKVPAAVFQKLNALYDREIAKQPQNLEFYLDWAGTAYQNPDHIFMVWQAATKAMPNNPKVAIDFAKFFTRSPGFKPQVLDKAIQNLTEAAKRYPQETALHQMLGDLQVFAGKEAQAIATYQTIVQAKASLCDPDISEQFAQLKRPENQRKLLNLVIQSFAFDKTQSCPFRLSHLAFGSNSSRKFDREIIAAIAPMTQPNSSITLRSLQIGLMNRQKQYTQIVKLGPTYLPFANDQFDMIDLSTAATLPFSIARAHEELGNRDQALAFYELLGEYQKQTQEEYESNWHLGRMAWQQKDAPKAIALLQSVTQHKWSVMTQKQADDSEVSFRALAHNLLGEIFQSQGKKAEAKQQFEAAIQATATFPAPKANLAN
ncbi:MAG: hypothetical protein HC860_12820 [Alkalinema sp. RU_4_3]|nr:hypothetical protein [Alkalinema sp. RU_4_3]